MKTLTVYRQRKSAYNITTILKDSNNKVKAIFSTMLKQPRKGTKTIIINCNRFALDWSKVLMIALIVKGCGGLNGGWL